MTPPGPGHLQRHDTRLRDVRQHAREARRAGGGARVTPQQIPEDMKTPGAPTPDVLEFIWDRWNPDIDQTVAKR